MGHIASLRARHTTIIIKVMTIFKFYFMGTKHFFLGSTPRQTHPHTYLYTLGYGFVVQIFHGRCSGMPNCKLSLALYVALSLKNWIMEVLSCRTLQGCNIQVRTGTRFRARVRFSQHSELTQKGRSRNQNWPGMASAGLGLKPIPVKCTKLKVSLICLGNIIIGANLTSKWSLTVN